jgi:hypothetical protein
MRETLICAVVEPSLLSPGWRRQGRPREIRPRTRSGRTARRPGLCRSSGCDERGTGSGPVLALGRAHTKPRRYESARHGVTAAGSSARCLQAPSPPSVSLDAERCARDARRGAQIGGRALVAYRTRRGGHASPGAADQPRPPPLPFPLLWPWMKFSGIEKVGVGKVVLPSPPLPPPPLSFPRLPPLSPSS